ncbi:MAG: acetyl-CoA carboxylase biotin carboxyl carrier protein subunit [Deltaproteobacteria bacterium]|nr:acetyl-CoA carboxylase biotin carboxyl carrier protein subunit [Deltaproteobacteria bacterium]
MPERSAARDHTAATLAAPQVLAPMPGKVLEVLVQPGDHVEQGDGLLILEAMKMENRLVAEAPGTVVEVRTVAGSMVEGGQVLLVLAYDEDCR